jgi:hypothetical protein
MIHIIDSYDIGYRHLDHYTTTVPDMLRDYGYEVNVISGTTTIATQNDMIANIAYKGSQFNALYQYMILEKFKDGDMFIFSNAWDVNVLQLRRMVDILKLKNIKYVGIWRDGMYDRNNRMRSAMVGLEKDWANNAECALYRSYDMNIFFSERIKAKFFTLHRYKDTMYVAVLGYPINIQKIRASYTTNVPKEDLIVIPHTTYSEHVQHTLVAIRRLLPNYTIIDSCELGLTRNEYYDVLMRAKIVLSIDNSESDPTCIYESICFGCIPIAPNVGIYAETMPDEYLYDTRIITEPFLNFVKRREEIPEIVTRYITNYDVESGKLIEYASSYGKMYFDETKFLDIIKHVNERRYKRFDETRYRHR